MPPKGKQATKGQKQIVEENKSTLRFYSYIIAVVCLFYSIVTYYFFWEKFTASYWVMPVISFLIYLACYKFMSYMSRPVYGETGHLIDGGTDLNMEAGMAEHVKDLILLTSIVQVLSLISNYFWILLLLAPGRAFYLLWVNILGPWFFQEAPEVDDKKQKKMERKMKRQQRS
ncbi:transmembrane protein 208-like [Lineus longissimus]|uniref:transmembrane protein 208-like n=1 Tax=Lineus longissimus TaxID=88925 RepID=UPI002B4C78F4